MHTKNEILDNINHTLLCNSQLDYKLPPEYQISTLANK